MSTHNYSWSAGTSTITTEIHYDGFVTTVKQSSTLIQLVRQNRRRAPSDSHGSRPSLTLHTCRRTTQARNKPTQQSDADNFSSTQTLASMLASKVSSHRACHLAKCQVGLKACAPTVRPSMANYRAGLSKAPQFTPRSAPQTRTNQHNQAIHKVNTPLLRVRHYRSTLRRVRHNS